jgi:low affinity Fe/Cu permease
MSHTFKNLAKWTARASGHPGAFIAGLCLIIGWAVSGPAFGFNDSWQLVINTSTSIATFLMVLLIQNTQYRDSQAMQVKVDELIRAIDGARNRLLNLEEMDEEEINALRESYLQLAKGAQQKQNGRKPKHTFSSGQERIHKGAPHEQGTIGRTVFPSRTRTVRGGGPRL